VRNPMYARIECGLRVVAVAEADDVLMLWW